MTHLLITGGSSYLGRHLVPLASQSFETSCTYWSQDPPPSSSAFKLDVRDSAAVRNLIERLRPEVIIHTVGSNRSADMTAVITSGTRSVAAAAELVGARLIHISTDVVFNGKDAPYAEDAPPTPIHDYGRAKAAAELFAGDHPNHVIVRTSLIYGLQVMDNGTTWIVGALREGKPVTLFTDQRRNPVWAETLCRACLELAISDYRGVLNVAGDQALTRAEFGLRMLDWWGVTDRSTLALGSSDPDTWPADCTLNLDRAAALLATPLLGIDAVLEQHQAPAGFFKQLGIDASGA